MSTKRALYLGAAAVALALIAGTATLRAEQAASATVAIDDDDIGGVATGSSGPEAGAWVIAEATDLPTANYQVWRASNGGAHPGAAESVGEVGAGDRTLRWSRVVGGSSTKSEVSLARQGG